MIDHKTTGTVGETDCQFAVRVSAYHDGELAEGEACEVIEHLSNCPACAAQLAFFTRVSGTFQAAPTRHLDADARQRLEELGEELQAERRRIKPAADVRWVRRLTAAAAVLFVVAAGKVVYQQQSVRTGPAGPVTPAATHADPATPFKQPVLEQRSGNKAPAVTDADFVTPAVPAPATHLNAPATGQSANH